MTDDRVGQQALDRALVQQEDLLLVYQPIHEARSRRIVAVEALLRQRRQSGEIRETSAITEAAEKGPELFVLDSFTMRTAWSDAARWMKSAIQESRRPAQHRPGAHQSGDHRNELHRTAGRDGARSRGAARPRPPSLAG